jgi:DNA-binding CsgD family transcriptional regulator
MIVKRSNSSFAPYFCLDGAVLKSRFSLRQCFLATFRGSVMSETEQLSTLIDDIYKAALDRSLWIDALRRAAKFVGAGEFLSRDAVRGSANLHDEFDVNPHDALHDLNQCAKLGSTGSTLLLFGSGRVLSTPDFMPHRDSPQDESPYAESPHDESLAARYDEERAQPQGIVESVNAILDEMATGSAQVRLLSKEAGGRVDGAMRERMRLIVPHLRRAMLIGSMIELRRTEAATLVDLLDGINAAMFMVSASGRIVHANASGHAMLAQGLLLRAPGGKLAPIDADAEQALCDAFATADAGDGAMGVKGVAVPLTARDGDRYVAHVRPLTSGARRRAGATCEAAAAVLVHRPAVETGTPQEVIAKHYKLSPTQLRVLLAIVQLDSVQLDTMRGVAEALGIAIPTLKTHLHRVFAKTGTKRKADLVKLVAGYANPLVN